MGVALVNTNAWPATKTWYSVIYKIEGNKHKLKLWPASDTEPDDWNIEYTVSSPSEEGAIGFAKRGGDYVLIDNLRIEHNVDETRIERIVPVNTINKPVGTMFGDLGLPSSVNVVLSDLSVREIGVTWSEEGFDSSSVGNFTIQGTLNEVAGISNYKNLQPSVQIIISKSANGNITEDFEGISTVDFLNDPDWEIVSSDYISVIDSGDQEHNNVLKVSGISSTANRYAKFRTSHYYTTNRIMSFDVFFPEDGTTVGTKTLLYVAPIDYEPYDGEDTHFKNGYDFNFVHDYNPSSVGSNVGIYSFVNGSQTLRGRKVYDSIPIGEWLSAKAAVIDGQLFVKVWKKDEAEPNEWAPKTSNLIFEDGKITFAFRGNAFDYCLIDNIVISKIDGRTITDVPAISKIIKQVNTGFSELGLPESIEVGLSDGTTANVNINWDESSYDASNVGTYLVKGNIVLPDGVYNILGLDVIVEIELTEYDPSAWKFDEYLIWAGNEDNVSTHHVFGLTTTKAGTILALSEARVSGGDAGDPHHIVLKRSTDNGKTWGNSIILADYSKDKCSENENSSGGKTGHCYANPTPVVDMETGRIIVFYAENFQNAYTKLFYVYSDDDGLTWSGPVEITSIFDDDPYARQFHLPGPGHGIQLKKSEYAGRLLVEVWHRHSVSLPTQQREYGCSVLYSDDGGITWHNSEYVAVGYNMNEVRIAEASDGSVLMNSRTMSSNRLKVVSNDGGATWGTPEVWESIGTYQNCDSGFLTIDTDGISRMLFSRPDGSSRNNTTIRISYDDGQSWAYTKEIYRSTSTNVGYSDITLLNDGSIGVLFPKDSGSIYFAVFNLDWLTDGNDSKVVNEKIQEELDMAVAALESANYPDIDQDEVTSEEHVISYITGIAENVVNNDSISVIINKVDYNEPVAGSPDDPDGVDGSFTFTVSVSKGGLSNTTSNITLNIRANSYEDPGDENQPAPGVEEPGDSNPKTGYETSMWIWLIAALCSGACIILLMIKGKVFYMM